MAKKITADQLLGAYTDSNVSGSTGLQEVPSTSSKKPVFTHAQIMEANFTPQSFGKAMGGGARPEDPTEFDFTLRTDDLADNVEMRAQNQTFGQALGKGAVRFLGATGLKTAGTAGYILHAVPALLSWDMDVMLDNGISGLAKMYEEDLYEALPIHKTRRYTEGGVLDQMRTLGFWFDDAIDGFAFLASAALTQGGLVNMFKYLKAPQALAKAFKIGNAKAAKEGILKTTWLARNANKAAEKTLFTSASLLGTLGEAGFEASDTKETIMRSLLDKVNSGEMTYEEAQERASKGALSTFWWNMAAIAPTNAFQMDLLFKNTKLFRGELFKAVGATTRAAQRDAIKKLSKKQLAMVFGKNALASSITEGLYEENIQHSIQKYYADLGTNFEEYPDFWSQVGSVVKGMGENLFDKEGQKAIALGAIIGLLPGGVSGVRSAKRDNKRDIALQSMRAERITNLRDGWNSFYARELEKDAEGNMRPTDKVKLDKDGNMVVNPDAVMAAAAHKVETLKKYLASVKATASGNDFMLDLMASEEIGEIVFDSLISGGNMEFIDSVLEMQQGVVREKLEKEGVENPEESMADIEVYKERARRYAKLYESVMESYGGTRELEKGKNKEHSRKFNNNLIASQFNEAVLQDFLMEKRDALKESVNKAASQDNALLNLVNKINEGTQEEIEELQRSINTPEATKAKEAAESIKQIDAILKESRERLSKLLDENAVEKDYQKYLALQEELAKLIEELNEEDSTDSESSENTPATFSRTGKFTVARAEKEGYKFEEGLSSAHNLDNNYEPGTPTVYSKENPKTGSKHTVYTDSEGNVVGEVDLVRREVAREGMAPLKLSLKFQDKQLTRIFEYDSETGKRSGTKKGESPITKSDGSSYNMSELKELLEALVTQYGGTGIVEKEGVDTYLETSEGNLAKYALEVTEKEIEDLSKSIRERAWDPDFFISHFSDPSYANMTIAEFFNNHPSPYMVVMYNGKPGLLSRSSGRVMFTEIRYDSELNRSLKDPVEVANKNDQSTFHEKEIYVATDVLTNIDFQNQASNYNIGGKVYTNPNPSPIDAIEEDTEGNPVAVTLEDSNGKLVRFTLPHIVQSISYDILLLENARQEIFHSMFGTDYSEFAIHRNDQFKDKEYKVYYKKGKYVIYRENGKRLPEHLRIHKVITEDINNVLNKMVEDLVNEQIEINNKAINQKKNELERFDEIFRAPSPEEAIDSPTEDEVPDPEKGDGGKVDEKASEQAERDALKEGADSASRSKAAESRKKREDAAKRKAARLSPEKDGKIDPLEELEDEGYEGLVDKINGINHPATAISSVHVDEETGQIVTRNKEFELYTIDNDTTGDTVTAYIDYENEWWDSTPKRKLLRDKIVEIRRKKNNIPKELIAELLSYEDEASFDYNVDSIPIKLTYRTKDGRVFDEGLYYHRSDFSNVKVPTSIMGLKSINPVEYAKRYTAYMHKIRLRTRSVRASLIESAANNKPSILQVGYSSTGFPNNVAKASARVIDIVNKIRENDKSSDITLAISTNKGFKVSYGDNNKVRVIFNPSPGNVYWLTNDTASGRPIAIKLNPTKISKEHALVIFNIFRQVYHSKNSMRSAYKSIKDNKVLNPILRDLFADSEEYSKSFKKMVLEGTEVDSTVAFKDILDLLVFHGKDNTRVIPSPDNIAYQQKQLWAEKGKLHYGIGNKISLSNPTVEDVKDFIDWMSTNKNYMLDAERLNSPIARSVRVGNLKAKSGQSYKSFLIDNGFVTTDVDVVEGSTKKSLTKQPLVTLEEDSVDESIKREREEAEKQAKEIRRTSLIKSREEEKAAAEEAERKALEESKEKPSKKKKKKKKESTKTKNSKNTAKKVVEEVKRIKAEPAQNEPLLKFSNILKLPEGSIIFSFDGLIGSVQRVDGHLTFVLNKDVTKMLKPTLGKLIPIGDTRISDKENLRKMRDVLGNTVESMFYNSPGGFYEQIVKVEVVEDSGENPLGEEKEEQSTISDQTPAPKEPSNFVDFTGEQEEVEGEEIVYFSYTNEESQQVPAKVRATKLDNVLLKEEDEGVVLYAAKLKGRYIVFESNTGMPIMPAMEDEGKGMRFLIKEVSNMLELLPSISEHVNNPNRPKTVVEQYKEELEKEESNEILPEETTEPQPKEQDNAPEKVEKEEAEVEEAKENIPTTPASKREEAREKIRKLREQRNGGATNRTQADRLASIRRWAEQNKEGGTPEDSEDKPTSSDDIINKWLMEAYVTPEQVESLPDINKEKVLKWFNKVLPGVPVHFVEGIIDLGNNRFAFGQVRRDGIYLATKTIEGAQYHEAFHRVSLYFLTPEQREQIYAEAIKRNKDLEGKTTRDIEEWLAEEFREFMLRKDAKLATKTRFGKLLDSIFDWIYRNIVTFFTGDRALNDMDIEKLFNNISKGSFAKSSPLAVNLEALKKQSPYNLEIKGVKLKEFQSEHEITETKKFLFSLMMNESNIVTKDENGESRLNASNLLDTTSLDFAKTFNALKDIVSDYSTFVGRLAEGLESIAENPSSDNLRLVNENLFNGKVKEQDLEYKIEYELERSAGVTARLVEILDNRKVFQELLEDYLTTMDYRTIRDINDPRLAESEEMDEEDVLAKELMNYDKASLETSSKENAAAEIKVMLSLIRDGKVSETTGFPSYLDRSPLMSKLFKLLGSSMNVEDMINVLEEQSQGNEAFKHILSYLNNDEGLKTKFFRTFNKSYNNFVSVLSSSTPTGASMRIVSSAIHQDSSRTVKEWNDYFYRKSNMFTRTKGVHKFNDDAFNSLTDKYESYKGVIKQDLRKHGKIIDFEMAETELILILNDLGIDIDHHSLNYILQSIFPENREEALMSLLEGSSYFDTPIDKLFYSGSQKAKTESLLKRPKGSNKKSKITYKNVFENESTIKYLALMHVQADPLGMTDSILGAGDGRYHSVSQHTYLSTYIQEIKKDPTILIDRMTNAYYNSNSVFMQYLIDNPTKLESFRFDTIAKYSREDIRDTGKKFKKITDAEDYLMRLVAANSGYGIMPTPGDRSFFSFLGGLGSFFKSLDISLDTNNYEVQENILDIFTDYALDEYNRIQNVKLQVDKVLNGEKTSDDLLEGYHFVLDKNGNKVYKDSEGNYMGRGTKFIHFPSLNDKSFSLNTARRAVAKAINESLQRELAKAEDYNLIITQKVDGKLKVKDNLLITDEVLDSMKEKGYTKKEHQVEAAIYQSMINTMITNIEANKMFFGDPAAFKNAGDFVKRVTGFTSTGDHTRNTFPENYYPGLAHSDVYNVAMVNSRELMSEYYDTLLEMFTQNILADNTSISVKDAKTEAQLKLESYLKVDQTDGQTFISPEMYRAIAIKLGDWGSKKETAYNMLVNDPSEFTKEELLRAQEVVLNPLKMTYVDNVIEDGNSYMLYDKMSLATLFRPTIKGTTLEKVLDRMEGVGDYAGMKPIHHLKFHTATKSGIKDRVDLMDEQGGLLDLSEERLKIYEQKFQRLVLQVTTDPHKVQKSFVGTQFKKVGIANIRFDEVYYEEGDAKITGRDLVNDIMQALGELSSRGKQKLVKQFKLGVNGKLTDATELIRKLKEEARRAGMPDNYIEALEADENGKFVINPDAIVSNRRWIQARTSSIVKKETIDLKLPGNAFVQRSDIGIDNIRQSESLRLITETGAIEAMVSISVFKSLIPNYESKTHEERVEFLEKNKNLTGMAYRIPTQGQNSTYFLHIVKFLDEREGDVIVLPKEGTATGGFDFDIDKLFFLRHNYKPAVEDKAPERVPFLTAENSSLRERMETYAPEALSEELRQINNSYGAILKKLRAKVADRAEFQKELVKEIKNDSQLLALLKDQFEDSSDERETYFEKPLRENQELLALTKVELSEARDLIKQLIEDKKNDRENLIDDWILQHEKEFEKRTPLQQNIREAVENFMLDSYIKVYTHKFHENDRYQPLGYATSSIKNLAYDLAENTGESLDRELKDLEEVSPSFQLEVKSRMKQAESLSVWALGNVHHSIGRVAGIGLYDYLGYGNYTFSDSSQSAVDGGPVKSLADFVNHSGGAYGTDEAWDIIGAEYDMVTNRHYYTGERSEKNAPLGNEELLPKDFEEGRREAAKAAKRNFGYQYSTMKDPRLIRNWAQVKYADSIFAVGSIVKPGEKIFPSIPQDQRTALVPSVTGGTGYAVGMAILHNKPAYVYNQKENSYKQGWHKWDETANDFVPTDVPVLTKNFAGIGTREINKSGKQAIRDVYKATRNLLQSDPLQFTESTATQGKKVTDLSQRKGVDGELITEWFSAMIDAHVDLQKDPFISFLNVNEFTQNHVSLMLRAGFGGIKTLLFTAQPILKQYAKRLEAQQNTLSKGTTVSSKDVLADELQNLYLEKAGITNPEDIKNMPRLSIEELLDEKTLREDAIAISKGKITKDIAARQIAVMDHFRNMNGNAESLFGALMASRVDNKKFGSSFSEIQVYKMKVQEARDLDESTEGIRNFSKLMDETFLSDYTSNSIDFLYQLLQDMTLEATSGFTNALENILRQTGKWGEATYISAENIKSIVDEMYVAITANFFVNRMGVSQNDIVNLIYTSNDNQTLGMRVAALKYSKDPAIKNNPLVKALIHDATEGNTSMLLLSTPDNVDGKNALTRGWRDLLYNPDPTLSKIGEDLVTYAYLTSGFRNTANSIFEYIPQEILTAYGYSDYIKELTNEMQNGDSTLFGAMINDFYENAWNRTEIVPEIQGKHALSPIKLEGTEIGFKVSERYAKVGYNSKKDPVFKPYVTKKINKDTKDLYKYVGYINTQYGVDGVYLKVEKKGTRKGNLVIRENGFQNSLFKSNKFNNEGKKWKYYNVLKDEKRWGKLLRSYKNYKDFVRVVDNVPVDLDTTWTDTSNRNKKVKVSPLQVTEAELQELKNNTGVATLSTGIPVGVHTLPDGNNVLLVDTKVEEGGKSLYYVHPFGKFAPTEGEVQDIIEKCK